MQHKAEKSYGKKQRKNLAKIQFTVELLNDDTVVVIKNKKVGDFIKEDVRENSYLVLK